MPASPEIYEQSSSTEEFETPRKSLLHTEWTREMVSKKSVNTFSPIPRNPFTIASAHGSISPGSSSSLSSVGSRSAGSQRRKSVSFRQVEIIELAMEQGDHPCCRVGPAVQMSNTVTGRNSVSFDDFEEERSLTRRSHTRELYLSSTDRRCILGGLDKLLENPLPTRYRLLNLCNPTNRHHAEPTSDEASLDELEETERRIVISNYRTNELIHRMDNLDLHLERNRLRRERAHSQVRRQQRDSQRRHRSLQ